MKWKIFRRKTTWESWLPTLWNWHWKTALVVWSSCTMFWRWHSCFSSASICLITCSAQLLGRHHLHRSDYIACFRDICQSITQRLYSCLSNNDYWSVNNRRVSKSERSSVNARTSHWIMLRQYCKAVSSQSEQWQLERLVYWQFERGCSKMLGAEDGVRLILEPHVPQSDVLTARPLLCVSCMPQRFDFCSFVVLCAYRMALEYYEENPICSDDVFTLSVPSAAISPHLKYEYFYHLYVTDTCFMCYICTCQLHWLKVPERVKFKLAIQVYKCLDQTAPPYLAGELHQSSANEARLRSASTSSLVVPCTVFQPSAVELFWSLLPDCGTLCRWTSRRLRQYLFSENIWKPISSVILFLNLL